MRVLVLGDGVAALTCSYLLQTAGFSVAIQRNARTRVPTLILSASCQALFCDILNTQEAFSVLPRIERRVVKWGPDAETITLPHSAVIVSEEFLLDLISELVCFNDEPDDSQDWTIVSSRRPLPESSLESSFGKRTATVVSVQLESRADPATCWIESVNDGRLFLIPDVSSTGWLMSVGGPLDS